MTINEALRKSLEKRSMEQKLATQASGKVWPNESDVMPKQMKAADRKAFVEELAGLLKDHFASAIDKARPPFNTVLEDWAERFNWTGLAKEIMEDIRREQYPELYRD